MRRVSPKSVTILTLLSLPLTALTTELEDGLEACSHLTDAAERLACFDALLDNRPTRAPDTGGVSAVEDAGEEAGFGLAEAPAQRPGPDQITSPHVGEFSGWSGDTIFRLENGQIWRQAQAGRMHWVADGPLITIRRTTIGTYWLSVEGVNARVRVRRVD